MTQEEKNLLLQDLCARLPYGVIIQVYFEDIAGSGYFDEKAESIDIDPYCPHVNDRWIENIKPYLRPMSSMTEEEKEDLLKTIFKKASNKFYVDKKGIIDGKPTDLMTEGLNSVLFGPKTVTLYMDWLLKHHFDFNNLIKRKLALPAPPDMYK